jgi:hypothetical protein
VNYGLLVVAPCSLVGGYQRLGGTCLPRLHEAFIKITNVTPVLTCAMRWFW